MGRDTYPSQQIGRFREHSGVLAVKMLLSGSGRRYDGNETDHGSSESREKHGKGRSVKT
jgi:hypothetical protein